jgi:hypothetical protein
MGIDPFNEAGVDGVIMRVFEDPELLKPLKTSSATRIVAPLLAITWLAVARVRPERAAVSDQDVIVDGRGIQAQRPWMFANLPLAFKIVRFPKEPKPNRVAFSNVKGGAVTVNTLLGEERAQANRAVSHLNGGAADSDRRRRVVHARAPA